MSFLTLAAKVGERLSMVVFYFTNCHDRLVTPFSSILDSYVKYADGMVKGIHIIFDGYLSSNAKNHWRCNPIQFTAIELTSSILLDCRKDLFLSNNGNKQMFIGLLAIWLISDGHVFQCTDDADTIIVDRATELAEEFNVCVHASDTDVFILVIKKLKLSTPNTVYLIQEKSNRTINMTTLIQVIAISEKEKHTTVSCTVRMWHYIKCFWYWTNKLFKSPILEQIPNNDAFLFMDNNCAIGHY